MQRLELIGVDRQDAFVVRLGDTELPGLLGSHSLLYRGDEVGASQHHHAGFRRTPGQVFIDSKNSALLLVLRSLSSRKSIASIVPMGLRMRRSTYIFLS